MSTTRGGLGAQLRALLTQVFERGDRVVDATREHGGDGEGEQKHGGEQAGAPGVGGDESGARDVLRFLVKVGQVDGRFDAVERGFVLDSMRAAGHEVSEADLDETLTQTRFRRMVEWARPLRDRPVAERERLLRTGVLLAAVSGRVATDEHQALREACRELGLERELLETLVREAVASR